MIKKMAAILLAFGILAACSPQEEQVQNEEINQNEEEKKDSPVDQKQKVEEQEAGQAEQQVEPTEKETAPTVEENGIDAIKNKSEVGISLDELVTRFGEPVLKDKQTSQWRYDFPKEGYIFESDVLAVDTEGLTNGSMEAQLFVQHENGNVIAYGIYYLKGEEIMQYRITAEGAQEYPASAD